MSLLNRSALLHVMVNAARRAARGIVRDYGEIEQLQVSQKSQGNFVSTANKKAEKILLESLSQSRPGWSFVIDKKGVMPGNEPDYRWIIDALDGDTNLLHGIPYFCISIAAQHLDEIIAGVIYDPLRDEIFLTEKGSGAYLNDKRIRVSARKSINQSVVATRIPHFGNDNHEQFIREIGQFMKVTSGLRSQGASALDLAYVAAGRYEGFWHRGLKAWDMAAGLLIVKEAGGIVSDLAGNQEMLENGSILAANSELHSKMLTIILESNKKSQ